MVVQLRETTCLLLEMRLKDLTKYNFHKDIIMISKRFEILVGMSRMIQNQANWTNTPINKFQKDISSGGVYLDRLTNISNYTQHEGVGRL